MTAPSPANYNGKIPASQLLNELKQQESATRFVNSSWRSRIVDASAHFDPQDIPWFWYWKDPSGLEDKVYPLLSIGQLMSIIGYKGTRKTLLGNALIASLYSDDLEQTVGFHSEFDQSKYVIKFDTEQDQYRIKLNRKKMMDALGLRADTLNYHIVSLEGCGPAESKYLIQQAAEDLGDECALMWIDSLQDLVPGRDENAVKDASDLYDFILEIQKGSYRDTDMTMMYTQHTNRKGEDAGGRMGKIFENKVTRQFLAKRDFKTNITTIYDKYQRDAPFPAFVLANNGPDGWASYEGAPEADDLSSQF